MEKISGNEPAFAASDTIHPTMGDRHPPLQTGLTIRQYFAAMAMSSGKSAEDSIKEADKLIKLLNEEAT